MSNSNISFNPGIEIEYKDVYSYSFALSDIAPVSGIVITDLGEKRFDLFIEMNCEYNGKTVWSMAEKRFYGLHSELYDYKNRGRVAFSFATEDFEIDLASLKKVNESLDAKLNIIITVDEKTYTETRNVRISPLREWLGVETHPETLCTFIEPGLVEIGEITSGISHADKFISAIEMKAKVSEIVKNIRSKSIVCARKDSYSPEKRQIIKSVTMLSEKSSVLATPLELAVLFCACAEKCGLNPIISFVKNSLNIITVYCGVTLDEHDGVFNESLTKLKKSLCNKDTLVFDPAILTPAQILDVERATTYAYEVINKNNTDLLFTLYVNKARKNGVLPISGRIANKTNKNKEPREELARIYKGLTNKPVFKFLDGEYGYYDLIPFAGRNARDVEVDKSVVFKPLEISDKPVMFAGLSDGLCSFTLREEKAKDYNRDELANVKRRLVEFAHRIDSKDYITSTLYENSFHEKASRMTFGNTPGMTNYLICGFVRIKDNESGETKYLPAGFKKVQLGCGHDYSMSACNTRFLVNTLLMAYLSIPDYVVSKIDGPEKLYEVLVNESKKDSHKIGTVSFIEEYALVKLDLSEFLLWDDVRKYGKNMLENKAFCNLITSRRDNGLSDGTKKNDYVFPLFAPNDVKEALLSKKDTIIDGLSVSEKTDVAVNRISQALENGERIIVSSRNKEFLNEVYEKLEGCGINKASLRLDKINETDKLVDVFCDTLAEASGLSQNVSSADFTEFDKISSRLCEFSDLITGNDADLNINLVDAALSYNSAVNTKNGKIENILEVLPEAFKDINEEKFGDMFDRAEKLVVAARNTNKAVANEMSVPLKEHPLYPLRVKEAFDEETEKEAFDIISRIIPVFADYRSIFSDISEDVGIDITEIKDIPGLLSLNELYRLIITAREFDVPEDFDEYNISEFTSDAAKREKINLRLENIEYRLKFFSKEIFEDLDGLLSGYTPSVTGNGNFIKKFLVKKNNKDVLLQYVSVENRAEFARRDIEEIYSLLEEYKQGKLELSDESGNGSFEYIKSKELAKFAREVEEVLLKIYPGLKDSTDSFNKRMAKIFGFVNKVSNNAVLSKRITYARARFAQVCSENECLVAKLAEMLGANFNVLKFDCGILAFEGFTRYLKSLEENLPALPTWITYLKEKESSNEYFPEFATYLETNGIKPDTDRIFAASLVKPAIKYLFKKNDFKNKKEEFALLCKKYADGISGARNNSLINSVNAYKQRLKQFAQNYNVSMMQTDSAMTLTGFVNKYYSDIFSAFPVVFVGAEDTASMFMGKIVADTLICDSLNSEEYCMLSSAASVKNVILIKYGQRENVLENMLKLSGANICDVSYRVYGNFGKLSAYLGMKNYTGNANDTSEYSFITLNGIMRRTTDMANPQEAEMCVTKALELLEKGAQKVGIFTLTHGQYSYILHFIAINSENDRELYEAYNSGKIKLFDANEPCFEKFEYAIVTLGAGVDKAANIGWSFGLGDDTKKMQVISNIANAATENIVFVLSVSQRDLVKLKKSSMQAEKLYYLVLFITNHVLMQEMTDVSEDPFVRNILYLDSNNRVALGKYNIGADVFNVSENTAYMTDFIDNSSIKEKLEIMNYIQKSDIVCENKSVFDSLKF